MTIEEKAKAYNEAIEELRGLLEGVHEEKCEITEEDIIKIFPELKESEDEKARRVLREIVLQWKNGHQAWCSDDKEIDAILYWLEKQGEKGTNGNEREIPNSEQKPADKDKSNLLTVERAIKVSPFMRTGFENELAKWSEEDEGFLNLLLAVFTNEHPNGIFSTGNISAFKGNCVTSNRIIDWLKSLKDRVGCEVNCTTTKEWSEEDKKILDKVITNYESGYLPSVEKRDEIIEKLKSLRPQSTWKPSDEQMKQLGWIANQNKDNMIGKELMSLYQDLKKLMEE